MKNANIQDYEDFDFAILDMESATERLQDILKESEQSPTFDMDKDLAQEALRILERSDNELEHFGQLKDLDVKDYHVWSIKKPEIQDWVLDQLYEEREVLQEETTHLEETIDKLRHLRKSKGKIKETLFAYAANAALSQEFQSSGETPDFSTLDKLSPILERVLYKLDQQIANLQSELESRYMMLDFLGRQIAALSDEPLNFGKKKRAPKDTESPPEDTSHQDGPSQDEGLLEEEKEEQAQKQDRGRKDERKRSRRGRGEKK